MEPKDITEANRRYDKQHGEPRLYQRNRVSSTWNESRLRLGSPLTDKRIAKYAREGWYSADFRLARRELWAKQAQKRAKREGNFDIVDGRLIYRPV